MTDTILTILMTLAFVWTVGYGVYCYRCYKRDRQLLDQAWKQLEDGTAYKEE